MRTGLTGGKKEPACVDQLEPVFAEESYALAVASTQGAPPNAAIPVSGIIVDCGSQAEQCNPSYDPATWEAGSSSLAALPPEFVPSTDASRVTDRNDFGSLVGYRLYPVGNQCRTHALYWEDDWSDPVDLGAIGGYDGADTEALGIQERTCDGVVRVVGRNATNELGLIWTRDELGSWTVSTLNARVSAAGAQIILANEINRAGWIVGRSICGGQIRAALLRPLLFECTGDLDHTGFVDGTDLALLLGAWGDGPICSTGPDLDLSGTIGAADLAILLGAWGSFCNCSPPNIPTCQGAGVQAAVAGTSEAPSTSTLELALQVLGFASVDAFASWGTTALPEELESTGAKVAIVSGAIGGGA